MSSLEFSELIEQSGVINDYFSFKEILPLWNLSMMTQKDEYGSDKHLNMTFTEFIEALTRVGDKLAIPHILDDGEINWEDPFGNPVAMLAWNNRGIGYKIESLLLMAAN